MKQLQSALLSPSLTYELVKIGSQLGRLRHAYQVTQREAAVRAGISRNTAYRIECGDAGVAIGQILRYLDAIAPGTTVRDLVNESSTELLSLANRERTKRASTKGHGGAAREET